MTRGGVNDMGGLRVEHCGGCDGRDTLDTPPLARSGDAPGGKPGSAVSCHHEHMVDNSPESLKRLLGDLDDPEHMERASDFDLGATEKRFADMVVRLERDFGTTCRIDAGVVVQDASYYGQVVVPAEATNSGADLFIRVSNFGSTAVLGIEAPGTYLDEEVDALLDGADRDRIERALLDGGYKVVPEAVLWERYDGRSEWLHRETRTSWFTRFFDYL